MIRLLDATRIALASTALAVGPGSSIRSTVTVIINTTAVTAARVSQRRGLMLATQPAYRRGSRTRQRVTSRKASTSDDRVSTAPSRSAENDAGTGTWGTPAATSAGPQAAVAVRSIDPSLRFTT